MSATKAERWRAENGDIHVKVVISAADYSRAMANPLNAFTLNQAFAPTGKISQWFEALGFLFAEKEKRASGS